MYMSIDSFNLFFFRRLLVYTYCILLNVNRVSNLIGRGLSCHGSRCRFDSGLTRVN